jgi:putative redox protein
MSVQINGRYDQNLKMTLEHGPSGTSLRTAAPADNMGDGSSFSPTDLLAASLGACMVTTMAIVAKREGISFESAEFVLEKQMSANPRRVAALPVRLRMPPGLTPEQRRLLEVTAETCPVARSLSPEIEQRITFEYPDS